MKQSIYPGTVFRLDRLARRLAALSLPVAFAIAAGNAAQAQQEAPACGPLENQYGPFDYRTQKSKLGVVEQYHFTAAVEGLIRGQSTVNAGGDMDYTLRAFPNHHRALIAMVRLSEKLKSLQPPGVGYPLECYFERALRFRPDDSTVRMIYARFLVSGKRPDEAMKQLEQAAQTADDNPFAHNTLGLIYFDIGEYDLALAQAHAAYALGFSQPALRDKLTQQGRWKEAETGLPVAAP